MLSISEKIRGYGADILSVLRGDLVGRGDRLELTSCEDRSYRWSRPSEFVMNQENGSLRVSRLSLAGTERQAIELAKHLFKAQYANVQPQSAAQANAAVYEALLEPGDTMLGMSASCGGHLAQAQTARLGQRELKTIPYGLGANDLVDYDALARLTKIYQPKLIMAGFSSYSRFLDFRKFREIADSVGALLLIDISHVAGLVAAGLSPSPISYADVVTTTTQKSLHGPRGGLILSGSTRLSSLLDNAVRQLNRDAPLNRMISAKADCLREATSPRFQAHQKQVVDNARAMAEAFSRQGIDVVTGGTDNHIFLLDLSKHDLTAHEASLSLQRIGVSVESAENPQVSESPFATYNLRISTSSITTRGLTPLECTRLANAISQVLQQPNDLKTVAQAAHEVSTLCADNPVYAEYLNNPNVSHF